MRRITMSEGEWRLLVDLVDGFRRSDYDPDDLELATHELVRVGLLERTERGVEVSELGRRVRADAPAFSRGAPRVWVGEDKPTKRPVGSESVNDLGPSA
ncbi:hypothetical protein [Planctomyces sp. SH-PL14]|uniref:hypothetical protein n=1 Tax=Planctomyces sp. SH-PL14 TaxID=1632864 RepID=UPI00078D6901|nr:hypothetical protein [Planctomyces sp. SH-PL14]AMV19583.1 hypothetical protein VT03_16935 [Planctomyces sp. SH-PL14]